MAPAQDLFVQVDLAAFVEDQGTAPATWDHFRDYVERYLKPVAFMHLSGGPSPPDDKRDRERPRLIDADRGTAAKQIARYRERFEP